MAKLYWRVKRAKDSEGRGGYWTWVPAVSVDLSWNEVHQKYVKHVLEYQLEEEE